MEMKDGDTGVTSVSHKGSATARWKIQEDSVTVPSDIYLIDRLRH
jgi:hypothetical protein